MIQINVLASDETVYFIHENKVKFGKIEVVEGYGKSTRRKAGRKTTDQELNELRLAIVTSVLDTRIAEREAASEQLATKALMELITAKQEEGLKQMSVEELQKMLK